jgi:hypothetical protein
MGRAFKRCLPLKFPVSLWTAAEATQIGLLCFFWSLIFNRRWQFNHQCQIDSSSSGSLAGNVALSKIGLWFYRARFNLN